MMRRGEHGPSMVEGCLAIIVVTVPAMAAAAQAI
jgi:hypothetical protein